jgi:hypothetical protein
VRVPPEGGAKLRKLLRGWEALQTLKISRGGRIGLGSCFFLGLHRSLRDAQRTDEPFGEVRHLPSAEKKKKKKKITCGVTDRTTCMRGNVSGARGLQR